MDLKYNFTYKGIIHCLDYKVSTNSKIGIGIVLMTYHFSKKQVLTKDIRQDRDNCLNCPFSYSSKTITSGKCYTHKGYQRMGLQSKLNSLNLEDIKPFNKEIFDVFVSKLKNLNLVRFGAYGEPVLMPEYVIETLSKLSKYTGYSHAYKKYPNLHKYFMASVHTVKEQKQANKIGFRTFRIGLDDVIKGEISCPASKEVGKLTNCISCKLCQGSSIKAKNIHIQNH